MPWVPPPDRPRPHRTSVPDVVLFQPALGYWEYFVLDVPISLLSVARHLTDDVAVEVVDGRIQGWQQRLADALATGPVCLGICNAASPECPEGQRCVMEPDWAWGVCL